MTSFRARLRGTLEGRIFYAGFLLMLALLAEIVVIAIYDAHIAEAVFGGFLIEHTPAGREGAVPYALSHGAPPLLYAQISAGQTLAGFALAFPLFLWLLHRYHDTDNLFMRRLRKIEASARSHKKFVRRWGPFGVFLFMLIPFMVNGPLVGAMLGRLCGIPTRNLLAPVVAATIVVAAAWTFAYDALFRSVAGLDRRIPLAITVAVVAVLLGLWIVGEILDQRRARRGVTLESSDSEE